MVEVKRGRGRPRKTPIGVFKLEENKRPVGRPPKKKMGRPKGSKNKPKHNLEQRVDRLELIAYILIESVSALVSQHTKKNGK